MVATRLYSGGAAPGSPAVAAGWEGSAGLLRCSATAIAANYVQQRNTSISGDGVANNDQCHQQWILGPLAAGTLAGTVKGQMFTREGNALVDAHAQLVIRVFAPDAVTVRGTALDFDTSALSNEFPVSTVDTDLTNRKFPKAGSTALTSVAITQGDYIVIEIGSRNHGTNTSGLRVVSGQPTASTDLPEDETTNASVSGGSTYRGWIEFSADIGMDKPLTAETGSGADALGIENQFNVGDDTGAGVDALAVSNQFALDAETGVGADALTVEQQNQVTLTAETGAGADALSIEQLNDIPPGRLWVGRFTDAVPEYTIENEIITHDQINEVRARANVVVVDGNDDSWTEYDRGDLTARDAAINTYLDQPELSTPGSVRQRAVEELDAALKANSPGGECVWQPWFTRMDRIYWIAEDGSKYESRIEGLRVAFSQAAGDGQGNGPFQRCVVDTGLMVFCPPDDALSYIARDLFERETDPGLGDALTGGTWVIY